MSKELKALKRINEKNYLTEREHREFYSIVEQALQRLEVIDNSKPSEALDYLERIRDVLQNDKCIDIEWVFKHEYNTIKQALIQGEINKKFKEIVVSKCVGTENLTYVKIAEDYDDYLSLFEDKIEKEYLLFKDEFELLKEMFKDE